MVYLGEFAQWTRKHSLEAFARKRFFFSAPLITNISGCLHALAFKKHLACVVPLTRSQYNKTPRCPRTFKRGHQWVQNRRWILVVTNEAYCTSLGMEVSGFESTGSCAEKLITRCVNSTLEGWNTAYGQRESRAACLQQWRTRYFTVHPRTFQRGNLPDRRRHTQLEVVSQCV